MDDINIENSLFGLLQYFDIYVVIQLIIGGFLIWFANAIISRSSKKLMASVPSKRFIILQVSTLITFSIYIFGTAALIIGVLQPPREFIIAAAGSIAVALGFALKDIATSIMGGLLLLFDRPFQVGDRIRYDGHYGEVLSIGLRTVRLRMLTKEVITIPNSRFITDVVTCCNVGEATMPVSLAFHVAFNADLQKARDLIDEVVVTSRYVYLNAQRHYHFSEVEFSGTLAICIHCCANVLDTTYEKDFASDIVLRVSELFKKHKIDRPYEVLKEFQL